jgi:hypothetical protein
MVRFFPRNWGLSGPASGFFVCASLTVCMRLMFFQAVLCAQNRTEQNALVDPGTVHPPNTHSEHEIRQVYWPPSRTSP